MYIKKSDKIRIIKWYIRNKVNISSDMNIDSINNLKDLEQIVRTNKDVFGEMRGCKSCYYDGRDFCKQCGNCKEWHWDKSIIEESDNYVFNYGYWKNFSE
ncbi:MAG: hypothetical protein NC489_36710 [Ruminococcus flavefaciens]|nr:hypothetical protein [Ruminococcus flavefaciens]